MNPQQHGEGGLGYHKVPSYGWQAIFFNSMFNSMFYACILESPADRSNQPSDF